MISATEGNESESVFISLSSCLTDVACPTSVHSWLSLALGLVLG